MEVKKSTNKDPKAYEILIRKRGSYDYASYCPQINQIVKGEEHEDVKMKMEQKIAEHINNIQD